MIGIKLPAVCDSLASEVLKAELIELCGVSAVEVDASEVSKMGQACLQVLVSAARTSGGISLRNPSDEFGAAVALTGLTGVLGLEAA